MLPKSADYASLSESYIIFICDFDYFHIGKAVGERISFLKDTTVPYEDGSHVYFLNSRYTEANASKPILEFLDLVRTNDLEQPYETPLGQMARVVQDGFGPASGLLARRGQLLLAAGLGLCLWEDVRIARNRERGTLAQSRWRYWLSLAGLAFVLLLFGRYGPGFDAQDFVYFKF